MTTDLLWGIALGSVILMGMVKIWQMSQLFVQEMDEMRELAVLHRTVGMAVSNATISLLDKNPNDSLHHLMIAKNRCTRMQFSTKRADELYQAMFVVIIGMESLTWQVTNKEVTHQYAVQHFRPLLNRFTAIGILLEGYKGEA